MGEFRTILCAAHGIQDSLAVFRIEERALGVIDFQGATRAGDERPTAIRCFHRFDFLSAARRAMERGVRRVSVAQASSPSYGRGHLAVPYWTDQIPSAPRRKSRSAPFRMGRSTRVSRKIVMNSMTQDSSIAATLRDDILRGQYRCGERLPSERDLAERFGVHRSTVRAAFKRLEQLGIADIRQGGARVSPIEEASLDVIEHLLALEDPPDPDLVDQTLETMSGFLALAARLGTERATDEEREGFITILDEMLKTNVPHTRRTELFSQLNERFVAASGNTVLHLVQHGLRTRYADYVVPDRHRPLAKSTVEPSLRKLMRGVRDRAPVEASEAIYELTAAIRKHTRLAHESRMKGATAFPSKDAGGTP